MKFDLEFVETHNPVFIGGINLGNKLYANSKDNKGGALLKMYYDTEGTGQFTKQEYVVVEYKDKVVILDAVATRVLKSTQEIPVVKAVHHAQVMGIKAQVGGPGDVLKSAQVETPIDKVQGGIKTVRRPRFQGQESQGE